MPDIGIFVASTLGALIAILVALFFWNLLIRAPQAAVRKRDEQLRALAAELEAKNRQDEIARLRADIKTMLGKAHATGEDQFSLNDETAANHWVERTHSLIRDAFGTAEATVFLSDAGFHFFSGNGQVKNWISGRLERIVSLIQRCDTIPIRENASLLLQSETPYSNRPVTTTLSP